jgi:23S rRNA pseudouridine1911/1915/1917 synthase
VAGEAVQGKRVDAWVAEHLAVSRSRAVALLSSGALKVDGLTVKASYRMKAGQVLEGAVPKAAPAGLPAEKGRVPVVFKDRHLAVVDKPAGLVVHPGSGRSGGTLVNILLGMGLPLAPAGGKTRPGVVHRLDKDTSGLMVVALSDEAFWKLVKMMGKHGIRREYLAVTAGIPRPLNGTIDAPLDRDPRNRERMAVVAAGGRPAVTHYEVVEKLGAAALVRVVLETGRTHQIRVHFSAMGWPVMGDAEYGGRKASTPLIGRQALHSALLSFPHPVNGREREFRSPLPRDMAGLVAALKGKGER